MMKKGTLILVVGRSGAGKDTLLQGVQARFSDNPQLVLARRVITRPSGTGNEDHEAASVEQFRQRAAEGDFLQTWQAHECHYALTRAVSDSLQRGQSVLANISRTVIAELMLKWPQTVVVEITAPKAQVEQRLQRRKRESATQIQSRLNRVVKPLPDDATIHTLSNDSTRDAGIDKFEQLIQSLING